MNEYPKWPHLENLDRVLQDMPDYLNIAEGDESLPGIAAYTVTEKVHGFNARFGKSPDGMPWCGSRNNTVREGVPMLWENGLQGFVKYAAARVGRLLDGETMFGEWAGKGIQKGINYGEPDFYAFGMMEGENLLAFETMEVVADALDMKVVPVRARRLNQYDAPLTIEELMERRDSTSRLDPEHVGEGIVIFPYPPILAYGRPLIAKFKTPEFEERTRFRDPNKGQPKALDATAAAFAAEYVTEARFEHVLQQALEVGPYDPLDVRMTGTVMRLMVEDCIREGYSDYDALTEDAQKVVGKATNKKTLALLNTAREQRMLDLGG